MIDPRIDAHAQKTLLALSAAGGGRAREALTILAAVKSGRLGGIYLDNQGVPALRARAWGSNWWDVIPDGVSGVVMLPSPSAPDEPPILVLRNRVAELPAQRDAALLDAWRSFVLWDVRAAGPCASGGTRVRQVVPSAHCLAPVRLPAAVVPPQSAFETGPSVARWDPRFRGDPRCTNWGNQKYEICKANIGVKQRFGASLPPLQPASAWENTADQPRDLDPAMLLRIMASALPAGGAARARAVANLESYVPYLNDGFRLLELDTVRSRAFYLAHFAGELGHLAEFGLKEIDGPVHTHAEFWGRGPLQVSLHGSYVRTLAYLTTRAEQQRTAVDQQWRAYQRLADELVAKLQAGQPVSSGAVASVWQEYEELRALVQDYLSVASVAEGVRADIDQAGERWAAFVFSAGFAHAAGCLEKVARLDPLFVPTVAFVGSNTAAACMAGGSTSPSGHGRAPVKCQVYACASQELRGLAHSPACQAAAVACRPAP